tara:strand:- start:304 stop:462 length:159 start_codon:yes stop_codon:yes gene_type:complete
MGHIETEELKFTKDSGNSINFQEDYSFLRAVNSSAHIMSKEGKGTSIMWVAD